MLRSHFVTALLSASALPSWLVPSPGRMAYVSEAPWPLGNHPEAALTFSLRTASPDPDDQTRRPTDAVGAPIGALATIVGLASPTVARLRVAHVERVVFGRLDRLVPVVPPGTRLVVAGGFGNEARYYPHLDLPFERAALLPTGTPLVALGIGVAPYDPDGMDFVRLRVKIAGGPWTGRTGWLPAAYAGFGRPHAHGESTAESACRCRILEFRSG